MAAEAYPVVLALTEAGPTVLRAFALSRIAQLPQLADQRGDVAARLDGWAVDGDGTPEQWLYCLGMVGADVRDRLTHPDPAVRLRAALIHQDEPHGRALILGALAGPLPTGISRSELIEVAVRRTADFDEITEAACAIAVDDNGTGFGDTWGILLGYAFPEPYVEGRQLTPAQRAFLRALAANDRLWRPRDGSCSLVFRNVGLPYDQRECRRLADSI
ncbi:hypothetical protein FHR83_006137 [Actinoplanes campanulatus]|uniref:HEAT repeat-containing protein n=1 Tax=Actinoplanes campanulatus TaxID=113559 RepID=A0A7W5FH89_9ACTN|nr:hypothetical protein [Actinoplanes campanulatus]MBB3098438.1 hypothetical protein [Actinoplanes campanulatus]GGN35231.1 hypothetical protein GCM10010109_59060 [Actinoplanes campanulatus]GID39130.1 hypothetical protein Aca09nite_56360 [Actinoplanes campanulatus]